MNSEDPITAKLDALVALTPIPAWERAHNWSPIEAELGFSLPTEYKAYAARFPHGKHRGLVVFHPDHPPFPRTPPFALVEPVRQYAHMFERFDIGRVFYPKPGGLIPWAMYESEAGLFWQPTGDDPDLWPVAACAASSGAYVEVPGTTLDALIAVLRGDAAHDVFPEQFYEDPQEFVPMDIRVSVKWGRLSPDYLPADIPALGE